jgi:hypothetical protein
MDLQRLQDLGGFVPSTPVTREVSWTHPGPDGQDVTDTFTVRVKKLSVGEIERLFDEAGKKPDQSYTARMIAETIVLDGDGRFTYDQAFGLDPTLAAVLLTDAVHVVNPLRRHKGGGAKN